MVENKDDLLDIIEEVEEMTGNRPATVQSSYAGRGFTVDGIETMDFLHRITKDAPEGDVVLQPDEVGENNISTDGLTCRYGRAGAYSTAIANIAYNAGKWYFEAVINPHDAANKPKIFTNVGLFSPHRAPLGFTSSVSRGSCYNYGLPDELQRLLQGGDVVGVAANLDDHHIHFSINGHWYGGSPDDPTSGRPIKIGRDYAAGVAVSGDSDERSDQIAVNFGAEPFRYQAPEGFLPYGNRIK